jgi:2'-5' RNA ligase
VRLFIAIDLDDEARHAIAAEQERLKEAWAGGAGAPLKWIAPERMHLTLVFLGEVDEVRSAAVAEAIARPLAFDRFSIAFGGLGTFPPAGAPRVLWLGLAAGGAQVLHLQREAADRVGALGITLEQRPFHPHLTLARWPTSRPSDRRTLPTAEEGTTVARVGVEALALVHSRLSPAGPTYTTICRGPLRNTAAPPLQSAW